MSTNFVVKNLKKLLKLSLKVTDFLRNNTKIQNW